MVATKRVQQGPRNRHGPLAGQWGTVGAPRKYTTEAMVEAVVASGGRLTEAAGILGCTTEAVRRRAKKEPQLRRAIALLKAGAAKVTFERKERRRRQRAREEEARREGLVAERAYRGSPGVEVVYAEEAGGLVQRRVEAPTEPAEPEADGEAPPVDASGPMASGRRGKRHPDVPWALPGWVLVRLREVVADASFGVLEAGDLVRVPPRLAGHWVRDGLAEPASGEESQEDARERSRGPAAPPAGGRILLDFR